MPYLLIVLWYAVVNGSIVVGRICLYYCGTQYLVIVLWITVFMGSIEVHSIYG